MQPLFPPKLQYGDEIRVITPARSFSMISQPTRNIADKKLADLGFKLTFGEHVEESDSFTSSSIESRVADLHAAFTDPNVKAIMTVIGGFNSNQLLDSLDWELIRKNPKILIGYSDITALQNAIYAKTGLVTYSGPHYSTFGQLKEFEFTLEYFKKCLMESEAFEIKPSKTWADDEWYFDQENRHPIANDGCWVLNSGDAEGTLLGANLCTFNLLQGTQYMPDIRGAILFLEDDYESQPHHFDRDLQSVVHQPGFSEVKGLVIGRFQKKSNMTRALLEQIVKTKPALLKIPVVANVDFGHSQSMITFPIGGRVRVAAKDAEIKLEILEH
jgi:muramoyltetrapeptide carboxypeptidase LdcA involved in peptidoglycan recycling